MRRSAVASALLVALTLAACGEGAPAEDGSETDAEGVGQPIAGSVAPLAQCTDWNEGAEEEKLATIADIQAQLNQAGSDGPTPDLPDEEAYDVLERACSQDYAAGFRLYKIYARAAAFSQVDP